MKKVIKISIFSTITILLFGCGDIFAKKNTFKLGESDITKNSKLKVGDYIKYGKYYNSPILWRIINLDENGNPIIFSEDIICTKAFSGNKAYLDGRRSATLKQGNYWDNTNLRQWLNSNENDIKWINDPPSKGNVEGENAYDDEKGFLHDDNFSKNEKYLIKPYNHKILLNQYHLDKIKGGEDPYFWDTATWNAPWSDGSLEEQKKDDNGRYEKAYYTTVMDSVFILNTHEIRIYLYEKGWECRRKLTKKAIEKCKIKGFKSGKYYRYWTSTPTLSADYIFDCISNEEIGQNKPNIIIESVEKNIGVCPAMILDDTKIKIQSGKGTMKKPYVLGTK